MAGVAEPKWPKRYSIHRTSWPEHKLGGAGQGGLRAAQGLAGNQSVGGGQIALCIRCSLGLFLSFSSHYYSCCYY